MFQRKVGAPYLAPPYNQSPVANVIKLFTNIRNKFKCLSPADLSSLVLCLWVMPGAYPRVEHLKVANSRLGWKGLPGTNTLAYYEKVQLTVIKGFII